MTQVKDILELGKRLDKATTELNGLLADLPSQDEVKAGIEKVSQLYASRFGELSLNSFQISAIVVEYETLVSKMAQVRYGALHADEAIEYIDGLNFSRKLSVVWHNIVKACEMLFWFSLLAVESLVLELHVPLLFINPLMAVLALNNMVNLLYIAAFTLGGLLACLSEFQDFTITNEEAEGERNVVSFFAAAPVKDRPRPRFADDSFANAPSVFDVPVTYPSLK